MMEDMIHKDCGGDIKYCLTQEMYVCEECLEVIFDMHDLTPVSSILPFRNRDVASLQVKENR